MLSRELFDGGQVGEAGRFDLASIRLAGSIRNEINAEFALRRLDGSVRRSRRHLISLCEQFEVMDERLHRVFHFGTRRRRYLCVIGFYFARRHLVQALENDAK